MNTFFCSVFAFMSLAACQTTSAFIGTEYVVTQPAYKTEITLGFNKVGGRFYGKALNNYFGSYSIKDNTINFKNIGATMMAGPVDTMNDEAKYLKSLEGEKTFVVDGNKLIIKSKDGSQTVYKRK